MEIEKYESNIKQDKKITFFKELFNVVNEISIEDMKNNIKINFTLEGVEFNLFNQNIGLIVLSKSNNELLWIDNINFNKHGFRIEGLGYFMIKYVIGFCKEQNFEIVCISKKLVGYYTKMAEKLKKEGIINSYNFVGDSYKDLILNLK